MLLLSLLFGLLLLLSLLAFQVNFCACELISCNDVEVGIELEVGGEVVAAVVVLGVCPVNLTFGTRRTEEYSISIMRKGEEHQIHPMN